MTLHAPSRGLRRGDLLETSQQMTLDQATLNACSEKLKILWPERSTYPRGGGGAGAERAPEGHRAEGQDAVLTPIRIQGQRELVEEHLLPLADLGEVRSDRPPHRRHSVPLDDADVLNP